MPSNVLNDFVQCPNFEKMSFLWYGSLLSEYCARIWHLPAVVLSMVSCAHLDVQT